jgi:hypothetical protein
MAADDQVAELARLRRADQAPWTLLQVLDRGALHHDGRLVVEAVAQARGVQHRDAAADLHRHRGDGRRLRRRRRLRPRVAQLVGELRLLALGDQVGDPQLVDAEQQQHDTDGDERLTDPAQDGPDHVGGAAHATSRVTLGSSSGPS